MKLYCYILGILLILAVFGNCEIPIEVKQIIEECEKEFGVSQEYLRAHPDDPKVKCYHACTFKKYRSMANGKMDVERTLEVFLKSISDATARDFIKGAVTGCANVANQEKEECEVAAAYVKCTIEKVKSYKP